jgi:prepilin-type N-terminal cleavage/methylation domain-containing protein
MRNAECYSHSPRSGALTQSPAPRPQPQRAAFTLVELLITITIISILAALVLGVAAMAGETAREARSKQLITRIHTLLMDHYDSFRNRRVEIKGTYTGKDLASARLVATREMLQLELPDRWSDIALEVTPSKLDSRADEGRTAPYYNPLFLSQRTGMSSVYWRRYNTIAEKLEPLDSNDDNNNSVPDGIDALLANQSAECLYMIVTLACGDGEARSQFNQNDIGDVDGDGAPEFIDGWGKPIEFLRWAPGYYSPAQLSLARLKDVGEFAIKNSQNAAQAAADAIAADHDPFDTFRVDTYTASDWSNSVMPRGFRLLPLVVSAGRDEELGMQFYYGFANRGTLTSTPLLPYPYADADTSAANHQSVGDKLDDTITDNITNHLIEYEKRR